MNEFGTALKAARKKSRKKLREVSEHLGFSISYISEIEQGRKAPPELDIVREMQLFLDIEDDHLVKIADSVRFTRASDVAQKLQEKPRLSEIFFRVKDMSDEELEEVFRKVTED